MISPSDAWAQMQDALVRIDALTAQRQTELKTKSGTSRKQFWLDAQLHQAALKKQRARLSEAHAALTLHPDAVASITNFLRVSYDCQEAV